MWQLLYFDCEGSPKNEQFYKTEFIGIVRIIQGLLLERLATSQVAALCDISRWFVKDHVRKVVSLEFLEPELATTNTVG